MALSSPRDEALVGARGLRDPYTGAFKGLGPLGPRPGDPDLFLWAGTLAPAGPRAVDVAIGGAGWSEPHARLAALGEGVERLAPYPLPDDQALVASYARWSRDEPAVDPRRWVLFHPEQYARPGFPFAPLEPATEVRWVAFRRAPDGEATWVPEELAYLYGRPGAPHRACPGISTGLSAGRRGDPILLRGLQEVVERDALMGAWWGRYALEEWPTDEVLATLPPGRRERVARRHLTYRCYRVDSPFSAHACIVTASGDELEGDCFSAGAACRETRAAAWDKALLEALQGRSYVRWLRAQLAANPGHQEAGRPADFAEHAVHFSLHPDELARTVLARPSAPTTRDPGPEGLSALRERLGPERPVLWRSMTPPGAAIAAGWQVLRVVVPGLQPMHGNHELPLLGGPLWAPRGWSDWAQVPPHPFP